MIGDRDERSRVFGALALVTGLGLTIVISIGVCGVAGYFADGWLGTSPALLIAGILFGVVVGAFQAYRLVMKAIDK
jgi:F0F1-type ATP synthase assembly protein I